MNNFKKLIAFCLAVVLMCPFISAAEKDENYSMSADVLKAIGVIGEYDPQSTASRKEFAVYLTRILGLNSVTAETESFTDVPGDAPEYNEIGFLAKMGILNGYSDGKFYPDSAVLTEQAAKSLVDMAGYGTGAQAHGGFPSGYMLQAAEIGIFDEIRVSAGESLTNEKLFKILYNFLDVDVRVQSGFGETNKYEVKKGKTVLTELMGLDKVEGIVTANSKTALTGNNLKDGKIAIDEISYSAEGLNGDELLGYNVTAYVDDDNDDNRILYVSKDDNSELEFKSEDIDAKTTRDKIYYEQNDKVRSKNIKNAFVVYNGRVCSDYTDGDFKTKSGSVKILDNDNDGEYEVVFITSYEVLIAQNATSDTVFAKYGKGKIKADENDSNVSIYEYGNKITAGEISEWDVLNVMKSLDKKYCDIYVTNDKQTGTVNWIGEESIFMNDNTLELSDIYFKDLGTEGFTEIQAGKKYSVYFDLYGKVVAAKNMSDKAYGYIIKANESDSFNTSYIIRMLVDEGDGEVKNFETADNFKVDGKKVTDLKDVAQLYNPVKKKIIRQLTEYTLDDSGRILEITTAADKANKFFDDDETMANPDYDEAYSGYTENEFTYDANIPMAAFRAGNMYTFEASKYKVAYITKTFVVSESDEATDDDFAVYPFNYYKSDTTYPGSKAYDVTPDYEISALVVNTAADSASGTDSVTNSEHMVVVDKILKTINSKGEKVPILYGTHLGKYVSYTAAKEDIKDEGGAWNKDYYGIKLENLPCGSAVQLTRNSKDEITNMRILFIPGTMEFFKERRETGNGNVSMYNNYGNLYTAYGRVIKKTKNSVVYNAHSDNTNAALDGTLRGWDRNLTCTNAYVTICNLGEKKVKTAQHYDIRDNDIVFLQRINSSLVALAVYRQGEE